MEWLRSALGLDLMTVGISNPVGITAAVVVEIPNPNPLDPTAEKELQL